MRYVWILLSLIIGILAGCAHNQQIKIVTDITPDGEVTYHTEYIAEF